MGANVSSSNAAYQTSPYGAYVSRPPLPPLPPPPPPPPPPPMKSGVIAFHSSSKWKMHFEASKVKTDFKTSSWCGPCKRIQPAIDEFAEIYTDIDFIKIDVDELHDVAEEFAVQVMPTFILLKRGKEVDKVVGAKKEDLRNKIQKHRF